MIDAPAPRPAVSEPIPCPSCGSLLRIPTGTAMIRCPSCKTVLAVEAADAPPAPPPPAPVAKAAPAAPPLPFGRRPKPAAPAKPATPMARPASGPTVRARVVRDDPPARVPDAEQDPGEEERRRRMRRELAELEEEERRERKRYDQLIVDCRFGRFALYLLAAGAVSTCVASVCYLLFAVTTLTSYPAFELLGAAGLFVVLHWLTTTAGFGYACVGPPQVRGLAVAGVMVTALQAAFAVVSSFTLLALITREAVSYSGGSTREFVVESLLLSNVFSNLSALTDIAVHLLAGSLDRPQILVVPMIGGAIEFAKLSLIGLLANRYATEGKDPDLAHLGMRFVYRIFGVVLVGAILKVCVWGLVKLTGGEPLLLAWFAIPLMMVTNGYYMWWAFSWYAQYQVLKDTVDVVSAERFADRRERLDVV